jgi:hypothetical protein
MMNNKADDSRARWRRRPRATAVLIGMVGVAVLATGCGGGGGGTAAGSTASPSATSSYDQALAWAQCMRSHGVPNFPDPSSNGAFNASSLNLQSAQMQSAQNACKSLQPDLGAAAPGQNGGPQDMPQRLRYAQCMRTHGVPNFPDPAKDGAFHLSGKTINQGSPAYKSANQSCSSIMSGSSGQGQVSGGGSA